MQKQTRLVGRGEFPTKEVIRSWLAARSLLLPSLRILDTWTPQSSSVAKHGAAYFAIIFSCARRCDHRVGYARVITEQFCEGQKLCKEDVDRSVSFWASFQVASQVSMEDVSGKPTVSRATVCSRVRAECYEEPTLRLTGKNICSVTIHKSSITHLLVASKVLSCFYLSAFNKP